MHGGDAVPTIPSSLSSPPITGLELSAIGDAHASTKFADNAIVSEMMHGVADDVSAPRGSFLCAPHAGALRFYAEAHSRLQVNVQEGWAAEHADVPFWPLRCDPYSVVDESERAGKPKFRLTNDHSWPPPCSVSLDGSLSNAQGQFVSSLNASMVRDDWPEARLLRVREVAEAAAVLQSSEVPVKAGVLDVVAYYKMFGRQAAELHRNGAVTEAGFLVEDRCCFGSAADAAKCCRASNFFVHHARLAMREVDAMYPAREPALLEWLAERRAKALELGCSEDEVEEQWTCLFALGMYVDDASHVSVDDLLFTADGEPLMRDGRQVRRATAHFEALRSTFHRFGLNTAKEQPPSECVELLGVELNLSEQRMRLTQRKRAKYAALCSEMAGRKVCGLTAYLELLGKLNFAATCFPRGRQWLHAPWRAARARYRTRTGCVVLSASVRKSLTAWAEELKAPEHAGVPLGAARFPSAGSQQATAIYADAALDCKGAGFAAWCVVGDEMLYCEDRWSAEESASLLICDLELAASTLGLVALQPEAAKEHVYSFTDNTVAMAAMRGLTPSTPAMQELTAARAEWMLTNGVAEATERVTSKSNLWADLGSRARVREMLSQAEELQLRPRRVPVPPEWRQMVAVEARAAADRKAADAHADRVLTCVPDVISPPHGPSPSSCGARGDREGIDDVGLGAQLSSPAAVGRGSGGRQRGRKLAGCSMVAEVPGVRQAEEPGDAPDGGVVARSEAGGRDAADGLRGVVGDVPSFRSANQRQDYREVHIGGAQLASANTGHASHRRPGRWQGQGSGERNCSYAEPTSTDGAVRRAYPGSGRSNPQVSAGARANRRDVGGSVDGGVLRLDARSRVRGRGRRNIRSVAAPHSSRHQLPHGRGRHRVCRAQDAACEGQARYDEERAVAARRRRDVAGPGEGLQAHDRARPGGGERGEVHTPLRSLRESYLGTPDSRLREVADGVPGAGCAQVRSSLAQDRRRYGGVGGGPESGDDSSGGAMVERRVRAVHACFAAGSDARRYGHRLNAVRGFGARRAL